MTDPLRGQNAHRKEYKRACFEAFEHFRRPIIFPFFSGTYRIYKFFIKTLCTSAYEFIYFML